MRLKPPTNIIDGRLPVQREPPADQQRRELHPAALEAVTRYSQDQRCALGAQRSLSADLFGLEQWLSMGPETSRSAPTMQAAWQISGSATVPSMAELGTRI